jgi:glycosyltransferase involved in cell wall biosynthesis
MRIGIDAREIENGVVTGIGRPLANFIRYVAAHVPQVELVLFCSKPPPIEVSGNVRIRVIAGAPTVVWDQVLLPLAMGKQRLDLFYSPYHKVPLLTRAPVVGQTLDLMFLAFPTYRNALGPLRRLFYTVMGPVYSRTCRAIVTDSQHAKGDIVRLWKVRPGKIAVIPLGIAARYRRVEDRSLLDSVRNRFRLPERFVLYLGNFKPHKNVEALVRAFRQVSHRLPAHALVLAGPLDAHGERIQALVDDLQLTNHVIFTGIVRESDRPEALLSLAELFVFPSLYEGFGLPPLEAMACGTPVVASNSSATPEVLGDAALLVDTRDERELCLAMEKMLTDQESRRAYAIRGLERARLFEEEAVAARLCAFLLAQSAGSRDAR